MSRQLPRTVDLLVDVQDRRGDVRVVPIDVRRERGVAEVGPRTEAGRVGQGHAHPLGNNPVERRAHLVLQVRRYARHPRVKDVVFVLADDPGARVGAADGPGVAPGARELATDVVLELAAVRRRGVSCMYVRRENDGRSMTGAARSPAERLRDVDELVAACKRRHQLRLHGVEADQVHRHRV